MNHLKIVLVDSNPLLVNAWNKQIQSILKYNGQLKSTVSIEVHQGTLSSLNPIHENNRKTTIVSPANSIGGMGGGFDEALCELYTTNVGKETKLASIETFIRNHLRHGYTPLGTAHILEFHDFPNFKESVAWKKFRANSIVVIPTMRVPKSIYTVLKEDSIYTIRVKHLEIVRFVFDCVWEIMCAVSRHNEKNQEGFENDIHGKIDNIILPGLGTGYGGLPTDLVSKGMIGALSLWGLKLGSIDKYELYRGVICLAFLREDYTVFDNDEFTDIFEKIDGFNILDSDVGEFYKLLFHKDNV